MSTWKKGAAACTLAAAAVTGVMAQADRPRARQSRPEDRAERPAPPEVRAERQARAFALLAGEGSEIGVSVGDLDAAGDAAGSAKGGSQSGVAIEDVSPDSPAAKAGIRKGDIVVEYDGERVRSARQFRRLVQETPPGRSVGVAVTRNGQRVTMTVEPRATDVVHFSGDLDAARIMRDIGRDFGREFRYAFPPPTPPAAPPAPPAPGAPGAPPAPAFPRLPDMPEFDRFIWRSEGALGIGVSPLSDQLASYFGVKSGVLVTEVREGSAAAAAGFKAGDVVTSLNGSDVADPGDLRRRTARLEDGAEFTAGVVRDKKPLTLKGKVQRRRAQAPAASTRA